jgi:hypothetical protein
LISTPSSRAVSTLSAPTRRWRATWIGTVSNPSSSPTDTKKATKGQQSDCRDVADFVYVHTAHVPAATAARSQFWSQLSSFVAIRKRPDDRFPSANGDLRISLDLDLRIWKAGWVHALAGSNPASSAVRILRCVTPTAKRPLLLNYPQWPCLTHLRFP